MVLPERFDRFVQEQLASSERMQEERDALQETPDDIVGYGYGMRSVINMG